MFFGFSTFYLLLFLASFKIYTPSDSYLSIYVYAYKQVEAGPHSSKEQLVDAVERHFSSQVNSVIEFVNKLR